MARGWKLALVVLLGLMIMTLPFSSTPAPAAAAAAEEHKHQHLWKVIEELKEARRELKEADHDFGGHRKEAIEAIEVAIKQVERCQEFDK